MPLFDYRKVVELMHFADEVIVFGIVCDQRHKITHLRSQRAHHAEVVLQITDSDLLTDYVEYGGDDDQEIARQIDDLHQNGEYLVSQTLFSVDTRDFLPGGQILIVDVISESVQLHLHHDAGIEEQ